MEKIKIDSNVLPDYKCLKCSDKGKIWDAEHECFEPCFKCNSRPQPQKDALFSKENEGIF